MGKLILTVMAPTLVLTKQEIESLSSMQSFQKRETAYQKIQGTKVVYLKKERKEEVERFGDIGGATHMLM